MHCFAAENDYDAGETGQRNGNLRGDTKSFARFHTYSVIRVVADGMNKRLCFVQTQVGLLFQLRTTREE